LRQQILDERDRATLPHGVLLFIGAATGFLSSLTGTGGPLVLVPILLSMRLGVLASVGLSQIFQLPVALAATAGNIIYGELDLPLGIVLAASLSGGSWFGAKLARAARHVAWHCLDRAGYHWRLYSRQCRLALDRISRWARPPRFRCDRSVRRAACVAFVNHLWTAAFAPCRSTGFIAIAADVEYDD